MGSALILSATALLLIAGAMLMATATVLARLVAAADAATKRLADLASGQTSDDDALNEVAAELEQAVTASQPTPAPTA